MAEFPLDWSEAVLALDTELGCYRVVPGRDCCVRDLDTGVVHQPITVDTEKGRIKVPDLDQPFHMKTLHGRFQIEIRKGGAAQVDWKHLPLRSKA